VRGNQRRGEPYVYLLLSWVIDSSVEGDAAATAGQIWMEHSSWKRGTVYRSLNRNRRAGSGFGDEIGYGRIRLPVRVSGKSIQHPDSAFMCGSFTFEKQR
jgi:hypothetical protein